MKFFLLSFFLEKCPLLRCVIDLLCVDCTHKRENTLLSTGKNVLSLSLSCCLRVSRRSYINSPLPPPTKAETGYFPFIFCVFGRSITSFFIVSPSTCSNDDMHQLFTILFIYLFFLFFRLLFRARHQLCNTSKQKKKKQKNKQQQQHPLYIAVLCHRELQLFLQSQLAQHIIVIQHLKRKKKQTNKEWFNETCIENDLLFLLV